MKRGREVRHARVVLGALIAGAVLAGNGALVYLGGTYAYYSDTTTAPLVDITVSPGATTTTTTATTTTSKARQTQQAPAAPEAGKPARPPGHDHAATRAQPKAVAPPTQAEQARPHRKLTEYGPDSNAGLPGRR